MHPENHLYGHVEVLRRYAGIETALPIPGQLQHGWNTGPGVLADRWIGAWPVFVWSRRNLDVCQKHRLPRAVPVGAPIIYLNETITLESAGPSSLIAFPQHGWECETLVDAQSSYEQYANALDKLVADGFGPVTVCLYWLEYADRRLREPFESRNFSVVCCGHRDKNPNFLSSLWKLLTTHAYVTSNSLNTALLSGLFAGCKGFLFGDGMKIQHRFNRPFSDGTQGIEEIEDVLNYKNFGDRSYREIGRQELGSEYQLAPEVLKELFGWTKNDPRQSQRHRIKMSFHVQAEKLGRKIDRLATRGFRT